MVRAGFVRLHERRPPQRGRRDQARGGPHAGRSAHGSRAALAAEAGAVAVPPLRGLWCGRGARVAGGAGQAAGAGHGEGPESPSAIGPGAEGGGRHSVEPRPPGACGCWCLSPHPFPPPNSAPAAARVQAQGSGAHAPAAGDGARGGSAEAARPRRPHHQPDRESQGQRCSGRHRPCTAAQYRWWPYGGAAVLIRAAARGTDATRTRQWGRGRRGLNQSIRGEPGAGLAQARRSARDGRRPRSASLGACVCRSPQQQLCFPRQPLCARRRQWRCPSPGRGGWPRVPSSRPSGAIRGLCGSPGRQVSAASAVARAGYTRRVASAVGIAARREQHFTGGGAQPTEPTPEPGRCPAGGHQGAS